MPVVKQNLIRLFFYLLLIYNFQFLLHILTGSENPTAIMKLISLSEAVKPLNGVIKTSSNSPANSKKASLNKNKINPQLPALRLPIESSSVSNVRKNNAGLINLCLLINC